MDNGITLLSVNWNQKPALEMMLKSYIKHNIKSRVLIVDNGSIDGSVEWLRENNIPHLELPENLGHEQAINVAYGSITTGYCLLADTDVEFFESINKILESAGFNGGDHIACGDYITGNVLNDSKVKDRLGAWFIFFDICEARSAGIHIFRDPNVKDWSYDVGSYFTEQITQKGYGIARIEREPGHIDHDLIGMRYYGFNHLGKVSWNLANHGDREYEVTRRRNYILGRLKEYEDVNLKNYFE